MGNYTHGMSAKNQGSASYQFNSITEFKRKKKKRKRTKTLSTLLCFKSRKGPAMYALIQEKPWLGKKETE